MPGALILEDGAVFQGQLFGARGDSQGEVVFNTGMVGYQEVLTDPSNAGQIQVMTYPLQGNYGANHQDWESTKVHVRGLIVREYCPEFSNWRAEGSLGDWLSDQGITGLTGVDTRALTRHLRLAGTMKGIITGAVDRLPELVRTVQEKGIDLGSECLVDSVSTPECYTLPGKGHRVVLVDYGAKLNIIRCLQNLGCAVTVVPSRASAADILERQPEGVVLSNGPGDPKELPAMVETVRGLLGQVPVFGICLGHQLLGLALGGDTYKLKFGHRGANHPVHDLERDRVYITSQNHGYAVAASSLDPDNIVLTHINLNDQTVEGMRHRYLPVFSVQYHPEGAPGPRDSQYLFERFLEYLQE